MLNQNFILMQPFQLWYKIYFWSLAVKPRLKSLICSKQRSHTKPYYFLSQTYLWQKDQRALPGNLQNRSENFVFLNPLKCNLLPSNVLSRSVSFSQQQAKLVAAFQFYTSHIRGGGDSKSGPDWGCSWCPSVWDITSISHCCFPQILLSYRSILYSPAADNVVKQPTK
jgi:hypothetical protein